jgi:hypothetical protein
MSAASATTSWLAFPKLFELFAAKGTLSAAVRLCVCSTSQDLRHRVTVTREKARRRAALCADFLGEIRQGIGALQGSVVG